IGMLPTGSKNCITDVSGAYVGHQTVKHPLEDDDFACTGVTAILPHEGNVFREKVIAARYVFNGFGKTIGLVWLNELGRVASAIMVLDMFVVAVVAHGDVEGTRRHATHV